MNNVVGCAEQKRNAKGGLLEYLAIPKQRAGSNRLSQAKPLFLHPNPACVKRLGLQRASLPLMQPHQPVIIKRIQILLLNLVFYYQRFKPPIRLLAVLHAQTMHTAVRQYSTKRKQSNLIIVQNSKHSHFLFHRCSCYFFLYMLPLLTCTHTLNMIILST